MPHFSRIAGFRLAGDPRPLQELTRLWGGGAELPVPELPGEALSARHCPLRGEWRFEACPDAAGLPAQIDIETDDLEAEANRLEERGARRIGHLRQRMWLLEAPGGERLRVLAAGSGPCSSSVHWG